MRFIKSVVALMLLGVSPGLTVAGGNIWLSSPNGFPLSNGIDLSVNCTFFVDAEAAFAGWRLKFANLSNANAKTWATNVTNANRSGIPTPGSIMVLDSFTGSSAGHVAWVTSATKNPNGTYTIAVLEGFTRGTPLGTVNNSRYYYTHVWTITPGNSPTALVQNGSVQIRVLAFLTRK